MDAVPGRIQYNQIRLLLYGVQHLQHITGKKPAIVKAVFLRVAHRCPDRLLHNLHTDDFSCGR